MRRKVFCLILNYRRYLDTAKCIRALQKSDIPRGSKIVIIDNSEDNVSSRFFRNEYPKIKLIKNRTNLGFAGGNNVGIRFALRNSASHILIINPDVIIGRSFFRRMMKTFETDNSIGMVAPAIRHKQNDITFYGLEGHIDWNKAKASHTNVRRLPSRIKLRSGDFVTFACVLIKRSVFESCGFIDHRYFMYLEDVDYCVSARTKGFKLMLNHKVVVDHATSSSFAKPTDKLIISFVSQLKFIQKWLKFPKNIFPTIHTLTLYPYLYILWTYHYLKLRSRIVRLEST